MHKLSFRKIYAMRPPALVLLMRGFRSGKTRMPEEYDPMKSSRNTSLSLSIILFLLLIISPFPALASGFNEAMDAMAIQITDKIGGAEKKRVAVVDFTDLDGETSDFGKYIAEEILVRLFRGGEVQVVERRMLKKVMEELKLQKSGVINEATAKRLGSLLGVDALCTGTIAELQRTMKVNARLISAETGGIFAVASTEIDKNDLPNIWAPERPEKERPRIKPRYSTKNYIRNGDFQQQYQYWTRAIGDINKGFSQAEIISFTHGKSNKALKIRHRGEGDIQYSQSVAVPGPGLIFSASFQASSHEGPMKAFSGSGVVQIGMVYLDYQGNKLGQTILVNYVKNPFADTPLIGVPRRASDTYKVHYVEISSGSFKQNYQIDIRNEIENNLMGVDPDAVRSIVVVLWCGATYAQAGSELVVTDLSLRRKP